MNTGVNATDELIWELQDQVQRIDGKVSRLLSLSGADPAAAGCLPGEAPSGQGDRAAEPNNLAGWCAARGWTLADAAGLTGYSPSYMSLLAHGKRPVSPDAKVRIARRLGARVAELFPVSAETLPDAGDSARAA